MKKILPSTRLDNIVDIGEGELLNFFYNARSHEKMDYLLAAAAMLGDDQTSHKEAPIRAIENERKVCKNFIDFDEKMKGMNFKLLQGSTSGYRIYDTNHYPLPWKVILCTVLWHWEDKTDNFVHTLSFQLKSETEEVWSFQVDDFPPSSGKETRKKDFLYKGNLHDLSLKAAKQMYAQKRIEKGIEIASKFNF